MAKGSNCRDRHISSPCVNVCGRAHHFPLQKLREGNSKHSTALCEYKEPFLTWSLLTLTSALTGDKARNCSITCITGERWHCVWNSPLPYRITDYTSRQNVHEK